MIMVAIQATLLDGRTLPDEGNDPDPDRRPIGLRHQQLQHKHRCYQYDARRHPNRSITNHKKRNGAGTPALETARDDMTDRRNQCRFFRPT